MRLAVVERGHRLPQKLLIGFIRVVTGMRVVDILRTNLYRPEFFGQPARAWTHAVMRGPSDWSVGERELFAAFTARLNHCPFCIGAHGAVAAKALGDPQLVELVLQDWRTAPVNDRVRAMLGFLEKLTLEPASVTSADIAPLRAAGLSDAAIEDVIHVCALFSMIGRLADALGFDVPEPRGIARGAERLLKRGYR